MNNRVTHFEIPCDEPEKTMQFFEKVFNWNFTKFGNEDYWFAITGNEGGGINGAIMKKRDPNQPITNSISVKNIDETIAQIENFGGTVVVPKMSIPESGCLAFFKDPDGNIHGIWQGEIERKMASPKTEHQEIMELISNFLTNNPNQRFGQALFNLGVNEFVDAEKPEKVGYKVRDIYNDSDKSILDRIKKRLKKLSKQGK